MDITTSEGFLLSVNQPVLHISATAEHKLHLKDASVKCLPYSRDKAPKKPASSHEKICCKLVPKGNELSNRVSLLKGQI